MSERRSPPAAPAAKDRDDPSGRIAFRLRIGVTGHRSLDAPEKIAACVREQLVRLVGLLHASGPKTWAARSPRAPARSSSGWSACFRPRGRRPSGWR